MHPSDDPGPCRDLSPPHSDVHPFRCASRIIDAGGPPLQAVGVTRVTRDPFTSHRCRAATCYIWRARTGGHSDSGLALEYVYPSDSLARHRLLTTGFLGFTLRLRMDKSGGTPSSLSDCRVCSSNPSVTST